MRRTLVQARTDFVITVRGMLRSWGVQAPSCDTENFVAMVDKLVRAKRLSKDQRQQIQPLIRALRDIGPSIEQLDAKLDQIMNDLDIGKVLMTCPGVGTIVAASFVSVIDDARRFQNAHQVEAYLGLVPSENTSGKRKLGSITKAGNSYLRGLLVQASWSVIRGRADSALKQWGLAIGKSKHSCVAVVAVARRLAGILWAMWRDGSPYDPTLIGRASAQGLRQQARQVDRTARAVQATC